MMRKLCPLLCAFSLLVGGCTPKSYDLEPRISFTPDARQIARMESGFPPLELEERKEAWSKELVIGNALARELDLFRAITAFKRAKILLPIDRPERRLQLEYAIVLCYYLGNKWQDVVCYFEDSELVDAPLDFPALDELLLILYDSYSHLSQLDRAEAYWNLLHQRDAQKADQAKLSQAFLHADLCAIQNSESASFVSEYCHCAKSVSKAQTLNALLPGAGYWYVGQTKSAFTSFALNTITTAAVYHFFKHKNYGAGLLFTSLEFGWYFGGINGAGLQAKEYNERLYERIACPYMVKERLFPILMFEKAF